MEGHQGPSRPVCVCLTYNGTLRAANAAPAWSKIGSHGITTGPVRGLVGLRPPCVCRGAKRTSQSCVPLQVSASLDAAPPTDSLAAVVLRGAAFRSDFNETACVPTPPASRCPIRHNIDGCTAALPAVNALARVEQRRGHYRCDANALLPQLAATRSLVSHVIVPLEALGNTARWLGIPRVGHEAGMCPLGPKQPQPSQEAGASSPLSLSTYRCTCTSRKVAADDARV